MPRLTRRQRRISRANDLHARAEARLTEARKCKQIARDLSEPAKELAARELECAEACAAEFEVGR